MAKVKYDLSGVEDVPDQEQAPVGIYRGKIEAAESKDSKSGNPMIEVRVKITHDASGKKVKTDYAPLWYYPILEHDSAFVMARTKEFFEALDLKLKGTLDTDKIVGKSIQVKLGSDTDQDGDYRPRIKKVMSLADDDGEADESEDEDEPEDEDTEDEEESEEDEDDEEEVDLDELDRKQLKALIAENELAIKVLKKHSDDDIRALITEALGGDEDEDEEDEEEDDDDESPDYDSMAVSDLKAALKERELPTNGSKKVLVARLKKDDGEEPF